MVRNTTEIFKDENMKKISLLTEDLAKRQKIKQEIEKAVSRQRELENNNNLTIEEQNEISSIKESVSKKQNSLTEVDDTIKSYVDKDLYEGYMYINENISAVEYRHGVDDAEYSKYIGDLQKVGKMEKYFNVDDFFDEDGNLLIDEEMIKKEEERLLAEYDEWIKNPEKKGKNSPLYEYEKFVEMRESLENVVNTRKNGSVKKYNPDVLFDEDGNLKNIDEAFENKAFYSEVDSNQIFKQWRERKNSWRKNKNNPNNASENASTQQETTSPKRKRGNAQGAKFNTAKESESAESKKRRKGNAEKIKINSKENNTPKSWKNVNNQRKVDQYYKNKNKVREDIKAKEKLRHQGRIDDYYKKKDFIKNSLELPEVKDRKDLINRIKNGDMTEADYLEQARLEELSKKANDKTISKKERKKARKELAKEVNNPLYHKNLNKEWQEKEITKINSNIESKNKDVIENYLDDKYDINKNIDDYNQFNKDLDLTANDYYNIDGNELDSKNKKINTTLRKAELKLKGFISGDYSDYNEYVEAVERLENMGNRDFKFYETENLFNSNGHLNNADDLDNLKPSRTVSAKDSFDHWQNQRKYSTLFGSTNSQVVSSTSRGVAAAKEAVSRSAPNAKKLFTAQGAFGVGLNLFNTVATYKEERKEGKSVLGSAARAGVDFALGEVLGMKYMGVMAAQAAPRAIVKGVEGLGKLTREKNNMQRHEAFGYASFQDTQQLATMRQSGMEMAKMANYNLQQTLMGNEAKYMHR